jgi:hypothetical protein
MIEVFESKYRAVSPVYVNTIEGYEWVYPSPLSLCVTIEDEQRQTKNEATFTFSNYYDSILVINFQFSIFMYLLSFDYHIDTLCIEGLEKKEDRNEANGYGGVYSFMNTLVLLNKGEEEVYDDYLKKGYISNRKSH